MTLSKKTATGVLWSFAEQLGRKGVNVVVTLFLARFLAPDDFGLMAMIAIFITIANSLMDSGFKQALIRLQTASPTDFNTAFYANIALGGLAYGLLFAGAPWVAIFYEEPRLIELIRVAGLAIVINSFQVIQSVMMSRSLNFAAQFKATLPASIISGIGAVALAYYGWGVWALIAQLLISALLITLLLWSYRLWRPGLMFSKEALARLYRFGSKLFLSGLIDILFRNLYVIVIARLFSAGTAGLYFFADKIRELVINQLVASIQTVTYPALATLQDNPAQLKAGYRKIIQITTFLLFPLIAFIAALAQPIFQSLLPERWLPAVPYFQLMCLASLLVPVHAVNLNILQVKGRSDLFLRLEIFKKTTLTLILLFSIKYGVIGILLGQIANSIIGLIPNTYFTKKLIGYSLTQQLADFFLALLLSAIIGGGAYLSLDWLVWPPYLKLTALGVLSLGIYLAGAKLLKIQGFFLALSLSQSVKNG
jgi:O-antigen/teichoic acid export membrane protein